MKIYEAKATRDGRSWLIEVPEIVQYTQARNVGEADTMVRDLISMIQEVPADSFEVAIAWELPATAARAPGSG